jgi:hypothetical protein
MRTIMVVVVVLGLALSFVAYRSGQQSNTGNWPMYQGRPAAEYYEGKWNCPKGWDVYGIESRPSEDEEPDAVCVKN